MRARFLRTATALQACENTQKKSKAGRLLTFFALFQSSFFVTLKREALFLETKVSPVGKLFRFSLYLCFSTHKKGGCHEQTESTHNNPVVVFCGYPARKSGNK
jgi:hypothetical protein